MEDGGDCENWRIEKIVRMVIWFCNAVWRFPRGWISPDGGILKSIYVAHLSAQYSNPRVNRGDAIIDTTR